MTGDLLLVMLFILLKRAPTVVLLPILLFIGVFLEFTSSLFPFGMFLILFVSAALTLWLIHTMHGSALSRIVAMGSGLLLFDVLLTAGMSILYNTPIAFFGFFIGTFGLHMLTLAVFEGVFLISHIAFHAIHRKEKTPRFLGASF